MQKKIVLVTGGFDPLHSGHIAYFNAARDLGDFLIVGINSDNWLTRKKGKFFLSTDERETIISHLRMVDLVIKYNDDDNSSINAIKTTRRMFPKAQIIFANGGDRTATNIPEMNIEDPNVVFKFGVGGQDKKNSSSWILENWSNK